MSAQKQEHRVTVRTANLKKLIEEGVQPRFVRPESGQTKEEAMAEHMAKVPAGEKAFLVWDPEKDGPDGEEVVHGVALNNPFEYDKYVVPIGDDVQLTTVVDGVIATPEAKAERLGLWATNEGENLLAAGSAAAYGYNEPIEGMSGNETVQKILADAGYGGQFSVDPALSSPNGIVLVGSAEPTENLAFTAARGTRDFDDVMADVQLMMGRGQMEELPPRLRMAQELGLLAGDRQGELEGMVGMMKDKYSDRFLATTGHSLGGHLAREAGRKWDVPSVTFNPAVGPSDMFENIFTTGGDKEMHRVVRTPVDIVSALSLLGGGNVKTVPDRAGGFMGHNLANFGRTGADLQLIREGMNPAFVDEYGAKAIEEDPTLRRLRRAPAEGTVGGKAVSDWYNLARKDLYSNGPRDSVQMTSVCEALMGLRDSGDVEDERLMLALERLAGGQCGKRLSVSGPGKVETHRAHNQAIKAMIGNRPDGAFVPDDILSMFPDEELVVFDAQLQFYMSILNDAIFETALSKLRKHVDAENNSQSMTNVQRKAENVRIAEEARLAAEVKKTAGKLEFQENIARSMAKTLHFFVAHPVSGASLSAEFARGTKVSAVCEWLADKVGCEKEQVFLGKNKGQALGGYLSLSAVGVTRDQTLTSWIKGLGGMEAAAEQTLAETVAEVVASDGAGSSSATADYDRPADTLHTRIAVKTHDSVNAVTDNALNGVPPGISNTTRGVDRGEDFIRGLPFVQEVVNGSVKMVPHWGAETHQRMDQLEMTQPAGKINDARDNVVGQYTIRLIENRDKLAVTNPEYVAVAREAISTGMVAPGATPSRLTQHALNGTAAAMAVSAHPEEMDGWGMDKTALLYNVIVEMCLYNPYSMQGFVRTNGVYFQFGTKVPAVVNPWWADAQDLCVLVPNDGQDAVIRENATIYLYPRSPYQKVISCPTAECSAVVGSFGAAPGAGPVPAQAYRTGNRQCATYDVTKMPDESILLGACTINQLAAVTCGQLAEVQGWESWRWNNSDGVGSNDVTSGGGHSVAIVPVTVAEYMSEGLIDIIATYGATNPIDMAQIGTWVDTRRQVLTDIGGGTIQDEHSRVARLSIQGTRHSGQFRTLCRVMLVLVDDMGSSGSNITGKAGAMGSGREVKVSQLRRPPAAANNTRYHPAQDWLLSTGVNAASTTNGNSINIFAAGYQAINGFQRQVGGIAAVSTANGPINIGPALCYRWSTPTFWTNGICTPSGGGTAQTICEYANFQTLTAARFKLQMTYFVHIGAPQHCWESAFTAVKANASVVRPQASIQGPNVRYAWFFNPNPTAAGLAGTGSSSASAQNWYLPVTGFDPAFPAPAAPFRVGYYDSETTESATTLEAIMCRPLQMLPQLWMATDFAVDPLCPIEVIGQSPAGQGLAAYYVAGVGTGAAESVDQWMYQVDPISCVFQAAHWIKAVNVISPELVDMSVNQLRCRIMHGATGLQLATQVAANATGVGQWAVYKPPVYNQFIETALVRKQIMHAFLRNAISRTLGNMPGWGFELGTGVDYYRVNLTALTGVPTTHFNAYLRPANWEQEDATAYSPLPPGTFTYFGMDPNTFRPGVSSTQESTSDIFSLSPTTFGQQSQANQINPWNAVVESMTLLSTYSSGVGPYGNEVESKAWASLAATLFMTSGAGSTAVPPEAEHIFVPGAAVVTPTKDGMWWRLVTGTSTLTASPQVNFMPVVIWAPNATMWRQLVRANQDYRGSTLMNPQFLMQISPSIPDFVNINNGEPRKMVINGAYNVYFAGPTRREQYIIYRQPLSGQYPITFLGASSTSVSVSNILSLF